MAVKKPLIIGGGITRGAAKAVALRGLGWILEKGNKEAGQTIKNLFGK